MTPVELKILIESDPIAIAAAQAGDWVAVANRCSVIATVLRVPVPAADVMRVSALQSVWGQISLASRDASPTPDVIKGICITFQDWVKHSESLDFDLPEVQAMASGLIAAGICTQLQFDAISAMGNQVQKFTALECRIAVEGK